MGSFSSVALCLLVGLTVAACSSDGGPGPLPASPSSASASAPSSPIAAPSESTSTNASPGPSGEAATARAVYWLGGAAGPRGPRLYREFVSRPADVDAVSDAVGLMLSLTPRDPDYISLWAEGTALRSVRREGSLAVVDLSATARTNGGGSAFEASTVQQLVHTVTAADPSVTAVRLLIEGAPTETLWGSVATSGPLTRGASVDVLGPVWLDVPEGGSLDGDFGGTATVFEATVSWQLRQAGRVVEDGFSTASVGAPGRGTWTATTRSPSGDYELWAFESSAEDGSQLWLDTKRVTLIP